MADASAITTVFVDEYKNNVEMLVQQMDSRLSKAVSTNNYKGKAGEVVNQIGAVAAQRITDRHGDTPILGTPLDRRWVYPKDWEWGDMIDREDELRMFIDSNLKSGYTTVGASALMRATDEEIVAAFFGPAKTGESGTTTKTFPSSQQVGVQVGGASSDVGLNVAKLKQAQEILLSNEVDVEMEDVYIAITAKQNTDLLNEAQVINADFHSYGGRPVLSEKGLIKSFMGFNFIHTQLLETDANNDFRVPVWVPSGMHLGTWNSLEARVYERGDKRMNTQVYLRQTVGATRVQEKKVVEIKCAV